MHSQPNSLQTSHLIEKEGSAVVHGFQDIILLHCTHMKMIDLRLPEWGRFEQEVLCMEYPVIPRTTFLIDSVQLPVDFQVPMIEYYIGKISSSAEFNHTLSWSQFLYLFKEYIFKQYKYNYYIKYGKNKVTFEDAFAVEKWPITLDTDSPVWFNFAWYGSIFHFGILVRVKER